VFSAIECERGWRDKARERCHAVDVYGDVGADLCFAKHPLRWLGKGVLQADRPLETLTKHLDQAEDLLDAIESALELSGLTVKVPPPKVQLRPGGHRGCASQHSTGVESQYAALHIQRARVD
jgi:hypothetical protein